MNMHVLHMPASHDPDILVPILEPNWAVEARVRSNLPFGHVMFDSSASDREAAKQAIAELREMDNAESLVWVEVEVKGRG